MLVRNSARTYNPFRLAMECQIEHLDDIYFDHFGALFSYSRQWGYEKIHADTINSIFWKDRAV